MEIIRKPSVNNINKSKNNVNANLKYYKDFPHGFLNLDGVFKEAKYCINDCVEIIQQLF
jgi:hypothetical protein